MIVEMMGRPAEHLVESMKKHADSLSAQKDVQVHSAEISEPKIVPVPNGKKYAKGMELFNVFAEIEFEVENMIRLTQIIFDFMPSSIEILDPSKIEIISTDATDLMNNISGKLHRYDEFATIAGARLKQMDARLLEAQEIIKKKDEEIELLKNKKVASTKTSTKKDVKKSVKKKSLSKK